MLTVLNAWYSDTSRQVMYQEKSYVWCNRVIQAGIKLINVNLLC